MPKVISIDDVWREFTELIDDPKSKEEVFHQYMVKYPMLIPTWHPFDNIVYSKLRLGNQHTTDFAFCRWDTPGILWNFIEIERPHDRLLKKNGDPSARLSHAVKQCLDWHTWFMHNKDYVARYFPHSDQQHPYGIADPQITLIIGRRQEVGGYDQPLWQRYGGLVKLRTFDSLKRELRSAWMSDRNTPLRCCSISQSGLITHSSVSVRIEVISNEIT